MAVKNIIKILILGALAHHAPPHAIHAIDKESIFVKHALELMDGICNLKIYYLLVNCM